MNSKERDIAALKAELRGYIQRGLKERAALVEQQLRSHGVAGEPEAASIAPAEERAVLPAAKKRTTKKD